MSAHPYTPAGGDRDLRSLLDSGASDRLSGTPVGACPTMNLGWCERDSIALVSPSSARWCSTFAMTALAGRA
jgi:hypothetical protein